MSEVGSHAGTLDLTNLEGGNPAVPDSSRSYGGPMLNQYKNTLLCGFVGTVLTVAAIALSAVSLQRSNEALALATANADAAKAIRGELKSMPDYVPPPAVAAADFAPPAPKEDAPSSPVPPRTPSPTSNPTPNPTPTPEPTAPQPTGSPTETHPLKPRWFHREHADYQATLDANNPDIHPYLIAGAFCHRRSMFACSYDTYCPKGKGNPPFKGGPPKTEGWEERKEEQWSPIVGATAEEGFGWVQVGSVPAVDGGIDGNRCWKWDEWEYPNGATFLDARGEEYQQWILCCDADEDEKADGEM